VTIHDKKHHFIRVFKPIYTALYHLISTSSIQFVSKNVSKIAFIWRCRLFLQHMPDPPTLNGIF